MAERYNDKELADLLRRAIASDRHDVPLLADANTPDPELSSEEREMIERLEQNSAMDFLADLWALSRSDDHQAVRQVDGSVIRQYEVAIPDCQGFLSSMAGDVSSYDGNISFCSFARRDFAGRFYFAGVMEAAVPESRAGELDVAIETLKQQFRHNQSVFDELDRSLGIRKLLARSRPDEITAAQLPSSERSDVHFQLCTIDRIGILERLLLDIWEDGNITYCTFVSFSPMNCVPYFSGEVGVKICDGDLARLQERLARTCEKEHWESFEQVAA